MNCRDFREIADSYLSDELAVETNHEIFQHLENCPNCRRELSMRREIREKLRLSLQNSDDFKMNPVFVSKLQANLKDSAFRQNSWFGWKTLAPAFAGLLIVLGLTFALFYRQSQASNLLAEISQKAVNRHEDCGLKHLKEWEAHAGKVPVEKISFVRSLQDGNTRILEVHDCEFQGKRFTHYILQRNGKMISVLKTASENIPQTNTNIESSIVCEREKGLQTAMFKAGDNLVFVISDMSEAENLSLARTLSDSIKA